MMSKRLFSDEPNAPKPLKELFWENAEKSSYGGILERQKELQRALRSHGDSGRKPSDALYEQA